MSIAVVHRTGNLSFICSFPGVRQPVEARGWRGDRHNARMCVDGVKEEEFAHRMVRARAEAELDAEARTAFAAEEQEAAGQSEDMLGVPGGDESLALPEGFQQALTSEEEVLEKMPFPGVRDHGLARRQARLKVPRRARVAIRECIHSGGAYLTLY